MNNDLHIGNLGEIRLIKFIEELILRKTGKVLLRDDSFFFSLKEEKSDDFIVLNSDMLVSSTDVPPQMSSYQIGWKSIIMNVSDLLVKGVKPRAIIVALGLPKWLKTKNFIEMMTGIIDCCVRFDLEYIGGDINETKEIIINPTIFGFKRPSSISYRKGIKAGDIVAVNNKFGLTGVGFNILLVKNCKLEDFKAYRRSIRSVLEPDIPGNEIFLLSEKKLSVASIDSSDGLSKSLRDLMISNPNVGFEIDFNEELIDSEAIKFAEEFNISLEGIVFNGGEEYIQLFIIKPEDFNIVQKSIQAKNGKIFKIGRVISEKKIYILKDGKRKELNSYGFEHFNKIA
jgi:thiamine-monophosphate kinase